MIKLYLKTITLVILLSAIVLSLNYFAYSYFTTVGFNHINRTLSKGTFSYIQTKLSKTPRSNWGSALEKIQPSDAPLARILPIRSLKLNKKEEVQLLNGTILTITDTVTTTGNKIPYSYFLYYGLFETFALQRIGNSQFALEIMLTEPVNQVIKSTMSWIVHIILFELNSVPKAKWPLTLDKLQTTFGIPLQLVTSDSDRLTKRMRQDLKTYRVAYSIPKASESIDTIYFPTSDPNKLLVIGPIQYSMISTLFKVEEYYYFAILSIASLLIVVFLTWLFSRNVRNIYQITKRYSVGDFSEHTKVSPFSILHGAYENVLAMGNNLNRLIQSQQNMTRFVAHEVRTPLQTMQFALDALKKEKGLSEGAQYKLISIQEDIEDINKLIGYFLLYYKTMTHELKLKYESLNISDWLNCVVKRFELSKINIILHPQAQENILIQIDPNLLKHAVDNLITNALKVAIKNIFVSLSVDRHYIEIHIEDDGPGISAQDMKTIFEPFATLNLDQNLYKHIGLGLTIAKSIIELHQGSIAVSKSNQLGGAKFIIKLPR